MDHIDYISDIGDLSFIDNEKVDYIYCSHALEYKDFNEALKVLSEWNRVLKKKGILRIAVPNLDALIELYMETNEVDNIIGPLYGRMEINNSEKLYHKVVYNFDKLKYLLEKSGFGKINKYDWRDTEHSNIDDHSQAYFPHMDKEKGKLLSLNVECYKV
jgi:predicted SAM-dependent methyltransferase